MLPVSVFMGQCATSPGLIRYPYLSFCLPNSQMHHVIFKGHSIRCTADLKSSLCRMYDGDKIVQLLEKGKDVILPPEFLKPLNREYKASPCLGSA